MEGHLLVIIFRLLHIIGGVIWVGAMVVLAWFLIPAQRRVGVRGPRLIAEVMTGQRLGMWLGIAAGVTMLSGFYLYGRNAVLSHGTWSRTPTGIGFGIGALAAIIAAVYGGRVRSAGMKLEQLQQERAAGEGVPSGAEAAELGRLQRQVTAGSTATAVFLLVAAAAMATARYW